MIRSHLKSSLACSAAALSLAAATAVHAQSKTGDSGRAAPQSPPTSIGEVVVTATRRSENIQKTPLAVQALGEAALKARGAQTVEEAIAYVPGVNFSSNGTNAGTYTIRGVATSSTTTNSQATVGLYIDDIDVLDPAYPKITTNLRLFDVERVEVLEGPQGTLFGAGALGGAIRIITNKPNLTAFQAATETTLSGTAGGGLNYDVNGMANIPLAQDRLALRVVGYYQQDSGYIDNVTRHESGVNYANSQGGRVELRWKPTPALTVTGTALFENDQPHDSPYSYYGDNQYKWNGAVTNTNYNETRIYSLALDYKFSGADLISITTFADKFENVQADFTADATSLLGFPAAPSVVNDYGPSQTFDQEVRLTSSSGGPFRWLVGAILVDNRRTVIEPVIIPGTGALLGFSSDIVSYSRGPSRVREAALYGEASYDVLPKLTATVGVRVFNDQLTSEQNLSGTLVPASHSLTHGTETSATPKFNLAYHLTPDSLLYAQAAEGYRIGQANIAIVDPISKEPIPASAQPDTLWNYEIGEKSSFLGGKLIVNADLYYIDWSNIQLGEFTQPSGINFIGNAGKAYVRGLELQVQARPTYDWQLGGSLSLDDSRITSVAPTVAASKGDRLPGSAPQNLVLYAEYTHQIASNLSWFARLDARYVGKEYADLNNRTSLTYGRYTELNLRGGLDFDRYSLTAFIRNAANGHARTSAFPDLTVPVAIRQQPITVGLTFAAKM